MAARGREQDAPVLAAAGALSIRTLPGVGEKVAEKLASRGLNTLQDLWLWLPRSYEDRTRITPMRDLRAGVAAQVQGRVLEAQRSFRGRPMLRVAIADDSGASVVLRFFHFRAAQVSQFAQGSTVRCFGTPRLGQHSLEIVHPTYSVLREADAQVLSGTLDPVYPAIDGIGPASLRGWIAHALKQLPDTQSLELLPATMVDALHMPDLRTAIVTMHRPPAEADIALLMAGRHPAQQRLALEELLAHHISLRRQRIHVQSQGAVPLPPDAPLVDALLASLPFQLTNAQQRVFAQVREDLARPQPMLRLVQGDVGSGKTVVAALAALLAVQQGHQAALMAPTELLAEQHLRNLQTWLEPLGVRVNWLAGKLTGKPRHQAMQAVADGTAQVVVGTHALMQEGVRFHNLALAIVDEQHRFGVHQRLALRDKGHDGQGAGAVPHQLVMTATPIPRTLAMSAYADLDVSAIDELPPGRTPVTTVALNNQRRAELIERIRVACAQGRQAYWVCTLIDDTDEVMAQAAQTTYEALLAALPELRISLVHGRMKPRDKQAAMDAFKSGDTQLLVATTVIEVGVDVPNASLMVIENAERLGLAQLHQLRGRVGRGSAQSSCVLLYQSPLSRMAKQRLDTLRQTNDGFVIAEKDLELRGPGELLGTKQTGIAAFRVADLTRDAALLPQVQHIAEQLLTQAPSRADALVARWIGSAVRYAAA